MTRALIALGSNLGDRGSLLRAACAALDERGVRVRRRSPVLETEPLGGPAGQGWFLNQVIEVSTELDAVPLLTVCRQIEDSLGRRRRSRWGPRTIDIDILTFGDERISTASLTVPHPGLSSRPFVAEAVRRLGA